MLSGLKGGLISPNALSTPIYRRSPASGLKSGLASSGDLSLRRQRQVVEQDPYFANVVLLAHFNGTNGSTTFTDIKGKTITRFGDTIISTAQSKFGGASAFFDGVGDYLEIANTSDLILTGTDFAIEVWINVSSVNSSYRTIIDKFNTAGNSGSYQIAQTSSYIEFYWSAFSTAVPLLASAAGTILINTWHFIQLTRSGNVFSLGIDGIQRATATNAATGIDTGQNFHIGSQGSGANVFFGYIDDLRVTKGFPRDLVLRTTAFPDS